MCKKSPRYEKLKDFNEKFWNRLKKLPEDTEKIDIGTLFWYAKQDNPIEYTKIIIKYSNLD
jgi:hypothetical protein